MPCQLKKSPLRVRDRHEGVSHFWNRLNDFSFEMGKCIEKKAICIFGGGLRSMAGASALLSVALAADPEITEDPETTSFDDLMCNLMSRFPMITSSSGSSWFIYAKLAK